MKYLSYLFAFLLLLSSVSAVCYNQNDLPFCSKDDPTCVASDDIDTDLDGWSDSCDAFPEEALFWVDYDGDNVGYGSLVYDCNDLDDSITLFCGDTSLLTSDDEEVIVDINTTTTNSTNITTSNTTTITTTDTATSSSSSTTNNEEKKPSRNRINNLEVIYISDPNDNFLEQTNPVQSEDEPFVVEETFPQKEIVPLVQPIPVDKDTNHITGAVSGSPKSFSTWPLWLLVLLVAILLFIAKKKSKEEN